MPAESTREYIGSAEAMAIIGLSRTTFYRRVKHGDILLAPSRAAP